MHVVLMQKPVPQGYEQEAQESRGGGPCDHGLMSFAEEAVNEVKRQAMSELQKAVSDAERKAHELISTERAKMERALAEARRQASEDALTVVNQQEDSSEVGAHPTPHPKSRSGAVAPSWHPHELSGPLDPTQPGEMGLVGVAIVQMKLRALGEVACPGKWQGLDLQPGLHTPELMLSNL